MRISIRTAQGLGKRPGVKRIMKQARTIDSPENRKRAKDLLGKHRGKQAPSSR